MRKLNCLITGLVIIMASTGVARSGDAPAITRVGDKYVVSAEIPSFSDFILVKTQMGKVTPSVVSINQAADDLAKYDVVFVGENHGHAANHYVQSKMFSALYARHHNIALSMEQFERSAQPVMDEYLAGKIGEEALIHDGKAWDHYRSSYRPLVEFAKNKGLAVIAAEVPGNMVSCVGEEGPAFLERLKGKPRGWIAKKLHVQDGPYKDRFYAFLKNTAGHRVDDPNLTEKEKKIRRFRRFSAQVSRDDTMAESIYNYLKSHPGSKVMSVNGDFHSAALLGTPERLRMLDPALTVGNIHPILVKDPEHPSFDAAKVKDGDYLLLLYPTPKRFVKMSNVTAFIKRTKGKINENRCAY